MNIGEETGHSSSEEMPAVARTEPVGLRQRWQARRERMEQLQQQLAEQVQSLDHPAETKSLPAEDRPTSDGARPDRSAVDDQPPPMLNWADQKKQLLDRLEAESGAPMAPHSDERMTIEGAIQITDQIVHRKEREIQHLKGLLSHRTGNSQQPAEREQTERQDESGSQREELLRLQQQWREKLRMAEVEISQERARIARQRAELEEKIRTFEQQCGQYADDNPEANSGPRRGRWLALLGLKED